MLVGLLKKLCRFFVVCLGRCFIWCRLSQLVWMMLLSELKWLVSFFVLVVVMKGMFSLLMKLVSEVQVVNFVVILFFFCNCMLCLVLCNWVIIWWLCLLVKKLWILQVILVLMFGRQVNIFGSVLLICLSEFSECVSSLVVFLLMLGIFRVKMKCVSEGLWLLVMVVSRLLVDSLVNFFSLNICLQVRVQRFVGEVISL